MSKARFVVAMVAIVCHTALNVTAILIGDDAWRWVPVQIAATAVTLTLIVRTLR